MRSQKGVLLIVVMMMAVVLGLFGNSEVWADSKCGHCNKIVSWSYAGSCSECGKTKWSCDSCGGVFHVCDDSGSSGGGGTTTSEPKVISITAVNNNNSVTLIGVAEDIKKYYWIDKNIVMANSYIMDSHYSKFTNISGWRPVVIKEVAQAGKWYFYGSTESKYKYDYKSISVYAISYNATGGTNVPATQYKAHGYELALTYEEPKKDGYVFLGWSTDSNATMPTYLSGGNFIENSNTTLYAVWKEAVSMNTVSATLSQTTYTYDGFSKMPEVTVTANGTPLTLGTDYRVSYQDNINAGTATVLIEGLGNYEGEIVKNFTIQKAPMQVAFSNKTVNYDGSMHTITARIAKPLGSYTVRYGTSMDSCTLPTLEYKEIGEYTIYCQIAGDENYESYSGSAKLTIRQVDVVPPTR